MSKSRILSVLLLSIAILTGTTVISNSAPNIFEALEAQNSEGDGSKSIDLSSSVYLICPPGKALQAIVASEAGSPPSTHSSNTGHAEIRIFLDLSKDTVTAKIGNKSYKSTIISHDRRSALLYVESRALRLPIKLYDNGYVFIFSSDETEDYYRGAASLLRCNIFDAKQ
ncbi:hypothetical protein [Brucella sp.]|uniref:hypothetical protein n=1 Tax=Brucella sp. TaxID=52132 RepID=UPI0028A15CF0|nr:hypothetical protein [Brucella sp.]